MLDAIARLTIGVAEIAPARSLWIDNLGLEVVAERSGPDADLARLWGIELLEALDNFGSDLIE